MLIDPSRRDLLFCMHEQSAPEEPMTYRYTSNRKANELKSKKYRKILQEAKDGNGCVRDAESHLSKVTSRNYTAAHHCAYIRARKEEAATLSTFYEQTLFRKLKLSQYIKQQQADERLAKNLQRAFGQDPILIMGNRGAPNIKYHEPSKVLECDRCCGD